MFKTNDYSSRIQQILEPHEGGRRLMPLAPHQPLAGDGPELLTQTTASDLLSGTSVASSQAVECLRSALYLYFSDLDASHRISQGIPSSTGSFLHAIMHRQEPDFSNSKYWFRRVGGHEIFPRLREAALEALSDASDVASVPLRGGVDERETWDPFWFVDQCQAAQREEAGDFEQRLMEIQRLEWQLLFDYCYRRAVGKT